MAERRTSTSGIRQRKVNTGQRRRITKTDRGSFADYSHIKASTGVVIPEVKKVMLARKRDEARKNIHRTGVIYPSEMARSDWCPRATFYRMSGYPEPDRNYSFSLENVFAEGNRIHHKWQSWLADTGLLWGDWRCTRCSEYVRDSLRPDDGNFGPCVGTMKIDLERMHPNSVWLAGDLKSTDLSFPHDWQYKEITLKSTTLPVSGHADGGLVEHNCLIELKSVGVGTLRFEAPKLLEANTHDVGGRKIADWEGMWKDLHKPLLPHVRQGNIYLWMAEEMKLPFDSIVFVYEFKANQKVKEFQIYKSDDILAPMLDMASDIKHQLKVGLPPDCPFGGCASCKVYEKSKQQEEDHLLAAGEATWD